MKRQPTKQGRRPRDLALAQKHWDRKRSRADLRTYRYLRMPQLVLIDFALGAASGFAVLALVMVAVGMVR